MQISPINGAGGSGAAGSAQNTSPALESLHNAQAAVSRLNSLSTADREFAVVRDPGSNRFVVVVRDQATGVVLDQFPPEDILKMLSQLSPATSRQTGETPE